ncbi:MAG: peptide chain release factor N(5)-glutamine methyltransferase [Candidatus Margulisiibacteriota bacterium]
MTWTIGKILDWTTDYFKKFKIEWPHLEAEILLAHALGLKRIELYTNHERILTDEELSRFKGLIQRRSKHEPVAYITGYQPFMSLDFYVDRSVLIPRPETEKLVEVAIDAVKSPHVLRSAPLIADIGTGCGAIAISLAKYLPNIKVIGIDSSPEAIKIAQRNAEHHQVTDRSQFIVGNLFEPLKEKADIIVSNPPYIRSSEIDKLQTDVKDWEPRQALDGGEDGLDYIKKLIENAPGHLESKGLLLIEIGYDQGEKAKELAENTKKYGEIKIIKDLNGKDRILKATKPL